ncbi:Sex peptide receptor [Orchesella cincta]|uniref:Sex peptide receptor n=1 Tax=Orchesella cincta TaxID=48709 RepID=A0A1D2M525_ORCCI|nr:Sex peptide receptor [Orchesella cincta]
MTFLGTSELMNETLVEDDVQIAIPLEYCGAGLKVIWRCIQGIHGYASLVVCLFGSIANILNLIVLTRREMINPTNAILTGLALADLLNMVEYVPYAIFMTYFKHEKTYGWAMFVLMHSNFSQSQCQSNQRLLYHAKAKYAIALGYIIVPIICIPNYLTYAVREIPRKETTSGSGSGEKKYIVNLSDRANSHPFLMTTNFWLYRDIFFRSCYMPLADLMDFFALLNSAINFILYCAMSRKFRETFSKLFWLKEVFKFGRQRGRKISQPVPV